MGSEGRRWTDLQHVLLFMQEAYNEVNTGEENTFNFSERGRVRIEHLIPPGQPTQTNGWDCGPFLLHYAEIFCRAIGKPHTDEEWPYGKEWLKARLPAEVEMSKRGEILTALRAVQAGKEVRWPGEGTLPSALFR